MDKSIQFNDEFNQIEIIEVANDEIAEIASEAGLVYPSNSIKIFKCIYAKLNEANKNGIILTRDEVAKSLDTLKGKPVNINHNLKEVKNVGYWLKGAIESENIVAWGLFWNKTYPEEYATFKNDAEEGKGRVSFEMSRLYNKNEVRPVKAKIIEFIGGAILDTATPPACADAKILSFASQENVNENARSYSSNVQSLLDKMFEVKCPACGSEWKDILKIDFLSNDILSQCQSCNSLFDTNFEPKVELTEIDSIDLENDEDEYDIPNIMKSMEIAKALTTKERNKLSDDDFGLIQNIKNEKTGNSIKLRRFPLNDENHVRSAIRLFPLAENITEEEKKSLEKKINSKAKEYKMSGINKEKMEKAKMEEKDLQLKIQSLETEVATLKEELAKRDKEIADKTEEVASKDVKIDELAKKVDNLSVEIIEKIEKARKDAITVTNRRTELVEFAKDVTDEDLLNDDKYAFLQLKKENAQLKISLSNAPKEEVTEVAKIVKGTTSDSEIKVSYMDKINEMRKRIDNI